MEYWGLGVTVSTLFMKLHACIDVSRKLEREPVRQPLPNHQACRGMYPDRYL